MSFVGREYNATGMQWRALRKTLPQEGRCRVQCITIQMDKRELAVVLRNFFGVGSRKEVCCARVALGYIPAVRPRFPCLFKFPAACFQHTTLLRPRPLVVQSFSGTTTSTEASIARHEMAISRHRGAIV